MRKYFLAWIHSIFLASLMFASPASMAQGGENADQLLKAYKTVQAKKDVAGMMALVLFQSGGPAEKASWKKDFEVEARMAVSATIVPLATYAAMLSPEARKHIRPSVKLVGWLVVEYPASKDNASQQSGLYPIGIENQKAFIVGP